MKSLRVERPAQIDKALAIMRDWQTGAPSLTEKPAMGTKAWLAGGQSLLAAMKLGLNEPEVLIDLQDLVELRGIVLSKNLALLQIGAMETHASLASSESLQRFCPGLAQLAHGIADQQVRNMGTIGGSLANNDPAACWPAGVLALNAKIVTTERELSADDFFDGIFKTVLKNDELIQQIHFKRPDAFQYIKFEQSASRFALLGVAVARFNQEVRVAITGLGQGVQRWSEAERALEAHFEEQALDALVFPVDQGLSDLHASAEYRAHLTKVFCRRCVAEMSARGAGVGLGSTALEAVRATGQRAQIERAKLNGTEVDHAKVDSSKVESSQAQDLKMTVFGRVWAWLSSMIRR